jgi:hypothetical protein
LKWEDNGPEHTRNFQCRDLNRFDDRGDKVTSNGGHGVSLSDRVVTMNPNQEGAPRMARQYHG